MYNPFKKVQDRLRKEEIVSVQRNIDIREFDGEIYICYEKIPLLKASDVKHDVCSVVKQMRSTVQKYVEENP